MNSVLLHPKSGTCSPSVSRLPGCVGFVDFPRPGHGQVQGRFLEGAGRRAEIPPNPRRVRQRQADHLQRLLHLADRHQRDARGGTFRVWACPNDAKDAGAGLRQRRNFLSDAWQCIGVEQDSISGRIAKARFPDQDIRIENFADSRLPELDAVIGNVPFADVRLDYHGQKFALHDFFLAKSVDSLTPGGVLALVTSHYTLDKQNGAIREYLASKADFLGAIRLPSDAFKREGTAVVTDIVFLRKRSPGESPSYADCDWLKAEATSIDGVTVSHQPLLPEPPRAGARHLQQQGLALRRRLWRQSDPAI